MICDTICVMISSQEEKAICSTVTQLFPGDVLIDPVMQEEAKRGTHIVHWPRKKEIVVPDHETQRIATGALTGCTAVAAVLQFDDFRKGYMQHMPPARNKMGVDLLRRFLTDERNTGWADSRIVIASPQVGSTRNKFFGIYRDWVESPLEKLVRDGLVEVAKEAQVPPDNIHLEIYRGLKTYHNMLLEMLNTGQNVISVDGVAV